MNIITAQDLTKTYSDGGVETNVLRGVSFEIEKGEFVAIMGPSGSGKSTLLHILGFLDENTGGTYRFEGKTITDYTPEELARVRNKKMGFVFQAFNLLPRTSVLENVKLPLLYSDEEEKKWDILAKKAIESVGLSHRTYYDVSQLSGGEKQRVAIARALVNNPELIFADEPTGNLDSKSGESVIGILQKLSEEKEHTIILITHDTHTAEHARRIIRILDGQIASDEKVANQRKPGDGKLK